ncbi:MAG: UDP-N-acetylmuramate--L-alanine ligase [Firmicutes bacterium]|nr:UDP-N-acetylmuramate--L-alanine ligase [Bacillota bacterium]MBR6969390.1 UDP-N-acetylmuramate--L-alanine ligase [Bacillota bacterium]
MDLKNYKHVHCVGIGGIGLSGIAEILLSRGYRVSGSDMKESAVTEMLEKQGAQVFIGHHADNLGDTDLLVYSAAVSMENPELAEARRRGIPIITRAEALGAIMADYQISVAVSGTHGKTTTTSMVSLILEAANYSPTILVGGILNQFHGNVKVGSSEYFVTEACEYMDSFLSLRPWAEIILNIDSDHLDYFKDINHIAESFEKFAEKVPANGLIVAFDSNPFVKSVTEDLSCRVITFGFNEASDYYAKGIKFNDEGMPSYDLYHKGEFLRRIELAVPGEHNVSNSLAAAATCLALGVDLDVIEKTLESFTGTKRRFDVIGKTESGVTVIDDYAHHPAEIRATLSAAKNLSHKKTWCLFQPHTYTRTMALFDQFADAFADADVIILAEIYAAREKNIYKMSSKKLMDEIKIKHPDKDVYFLPDFASMAEFVCNNTSPGDIVITMGAGDIYKVGELILEKAGK